MAGRGHVLTGGARGAPGRHERRRDVVLPRSGHRAKFGDGGFCEGCV